VAGTEKSTGQFNINGNRDRSNNFTPTEPITAILLPIDAIQEFNLESQFPAEYGRQQRLGCAHHCKSRNG
jgi:hypothetical protein